MNTHTSTVATAAERVHALLRDSSFATLQEFRQTCMDAGSSEGVLLADAEMARRDALDRPTIGVLGAAIDMQAV